MKVFIALIPDTETGVKIDRLRARYYPRSLTLHPPHLTLVAPFETENLTTLPERLTKLKLPPPRLSIIGLDVFPGKKNLLYLEVQLTDELKRFQAEVSFLAGEKMTHPFHPHFTIGHLTEDELKAAQLELANKSWAWPFEVSKMVIFRKEDDRWVEAVTYQPDISQRRRSPPKR